MLYKYVILKLRGHKPMSITVGYSPIPIFDQTKCSTSVMVNHNGSTKMKVNNYGCTEDDASISIHKPEDASIILRLHKGFRYTMLLIWYNNSHLN